MTGKFAKQSAQEIVRVLLFEDEAKLGGDGVESGEEFVKVLQTFAPATESGKSLTQLRLYQRIFRYQCSYMIYSKAFASLPEVVKERVFITLREKTQGLVIRKGP